MSKEQWNIKLKRKSTYNLVSVLIFLECLLGTSYLFPWTTIFKKCRQIKPAFQEGSYFIILLLHRWIVLHFLMTGLYF